METLFLGPSLPLICIKVIQLTCIYVFIHLFGVIGESPQFRPFNTTSSICMISSSEHAPSVTNANSCNLGGYISSILAAMNRHVTPKNMIVLFFSEGMLELTGGHDAWKKGILWQVKGIISTA